MKHIPLFTAVFMAFCVLALQPGSARADSAAEISRSARTALKTLYSINPAARAVGEKAVAVLVFPRIIKGGFMVGGQVGNGALFINGKTAGYYNTVAASYGFQAGLQKFSYAMFFMNRQALGYLNKSGGWEVGSAPSLVVVDTGVARSLSTTTLQNGIYVFFFGQKGLMGGISLQGTKITRYTPSG